jgi:hypothetical protein
VVDWYYIFPILSLRVYPCSPDIYNVVECLHLFFLFRNLIPPHLSIVLMFPFLTVRRESPAYAKASCRQARRQAKIQNKPKEGDVGSKTTCQLSQKRTRCFFSYDPRFFILIRSTAPNPDFQTGVKSAAQG